MGSDDGQARAVGRIRGKPERTRLRQSVFGPSGSCRHGGWSQPATLMVSIVVFKAANGRFGAIPADEIDGDEGVLVAEIDPRA